MKFQVLLSAMHLTDESYIDSLHITSDCVVINQCDNSAEREIKRESGQTITYVETTQRGLSRSRNMAIAKADADICILCDNDVEYEPNYESMIMQAFAQYSDADLLVFYIKRKERLQPNFPTARRMNYLSVLKIFSPEIAFYRDAIAGIHFREEFGAGSGKYLMGEENLFLYDCLKAGKKIYYIPVKIATLREEESTWFSGYDEKFFISRGANYAAMSRFWSHLLIWQFALRKRNLYRDNMGMGKAVKIMYNGRAEYIRNH